MIISIYELSKMEAEYEFAQEQIDKALHCDDYVSAIEECYNWADIIARKYGFTYNRNWKLFKKKLVACYFGAPPSKSFSKNMNPIDAFKEFKELYNNSVLRMTIHKNNEACHSKSMALDYGEEITQFSSALNQLCDQDCIVVFPESSGPHSICFRYSIDDLCQDIYFEAGYGQAYLTFENERGLHPTASMQKNFFSRQYCISGEDSLVLWLRNLIEKYGDYLIMNANRMCRLLGMDYISIEGYYNFGEKTCPIIVDCDLPFDKVFFKKVDRND
ncbi:MAG: hypothetical protein OSJ39_00315 [Clostridia bacterium]|uniref:hypothetical protein n=1 Tax=Anaerocaecibacter muris TaxID=2941513 RepID=UPI00203D771D|nr:hypothetical protein [Anaerocaecibacter muris]MCX4384223.1 hypothetical protein [Clostridia bacterium]